MPAVAIMTLTGVSPDFVVEHPLWGRTVNLRLVDDIPAGPGVAGYTAPGWRVATEYAAGCTHEQRSRQQGLRHPPSRAAGRRRLATGASGRGLGGRRDPGLRTHPSPRTRNSGPRRAASYVRFVGIAVTGAQIIARDAAKKSGLKTSDEPLIVTRAPSVAGAIADQYRAIARAASVPLLAWTLCILIAAGLSKWQERRRR